MAHRLPMFGLASILMLSTAALPACGGPTYDYSHEPDPRKHEYVIGVGDTLKIDVWKKPDLSTTCIVRPDGTITMALVGDLHAAGRTPSQLKDEVFNQLKAFVKDETNNVTITVGEVNSYRFTVSGNAEHPGVFSKNYYVTVADAVALAGGVNKFGSTKKLIILRQQANGGVKKIPINFDRISGGDHPEENIVLLAGDTLFVP